MAKNYIQEGDTIVITAGSALASGAGVQVGRIFGVAANEIAAGAEGPINLTGVYDLPKTTAQAWTAGALIYWSGTACTNVAATNILIGIATRAQLAADTVGRVRLNGAGITP
jgi:predicted RecA/RadA family phage recombinase